MLKELKIHHIGVLTGSIDATLNYYLEIGFETTEKIYDPIQDVNICFLSKSASPDIELVEPVSEKSKVAGIFKKNGAGPYHFCYETDNIHETILQLKKKKFILLSNPVEAVAIDSRLICFLYNKEVGLIELVQLK